MHCPDPLSAGYPSRPLGKCYFGHYLAMADCEQNTASLIFKVKPTDQPTVTACAIQTQVDIVSAATIRKKMVGAKINNKTENVLYSGC